MPVGVSERAISSLRKWLGPKADPLKERILRATLSELGKPVSERRKIGSLFPGIPLSTIQAAERHARTVQRIERAEARGLSVPNPLARRGEAEVLRGFSAEKIPEGKELVIARLEFRDPATGEFRRLLVDVLSRRGEKVVNVLIAVAAVLAERGGRGTSEEIRDYLQAFVDANARYNLYRQ